MTQSTTTRDAGPAGFTEAPAPAARATVEGTGRFAARHRTSFVPDFFRAAHGGLSTSSLGVGTYLGSDSDADDSAYCTVVKHAIRAGINVIDTAINYRCQRSERAVARAIAASIRAGEIRRDEILVCTKGGYIPLDVSPPNTAEGYQGYLRREFFGRRVLTAADIVAGGHSLAPGFIADCIDRSRRNLALETIDLYYIHNAEQQLAAVTYEELLSRLRQLFTLLERKIADGEIAAYGCATWQALRVPPGDRRHIALRDLVGLAREVGGDGHGFAAVQLPVNLAMSEGLTLPTQPVGRGDELLPAVTAARELGLSVFTSAPIMQGQLASNLPPSLHEAIPGCRSDAQRALTFTRGAPGVCTALVGMRSPEHLSENLEIARVG
jgi:aryl-alcohol dehydrogenase-like predicted oxidoreductase